MTEQSTDASALRIYTRVLTEDYLSAKAAIREAGFNRFVESPFNHAPRDADIGVEVTGEFDDQDQQVVLAQIERILDAVGVQSHPIAHAMTVHEVPPACALCDGAPRDGELIHWNVNRTAWVHSGCLAVEEIEKRSGPKSPWRQGSKEVYVST